MEAYWKHRSTGNCQKKKKGSHLYLPGINYHKSSVNCLLRQLFQTTRHGRPRVAQGRRGRLTRTCTTYIIDASVSNTRTRFCGWSIVVVLCPALYGTCCWLGKSETAVSSPTGSDRKYANRGRSNRRGLPPYLPSSMCALL